MHTANPHGPAKSPTVFVTFNSDSANAEAHVLNRSWDGLLLITLIVIGYKELHICL